ncbi:MAG: four-carbon acid sugar kinase family protein [Streptosporangiaceae bacterium]
MLRDRPPAASEVFAGLPEAIPDNDALRESIRAMRAADGLLLGVLDDDPTGSQAVHGVQVVTVLEETAYEAAFGAASTCFVLTNTRSLAEPAAVERNTLAALGLIAVAERRDARIQLISRSDSTLRGHVMAEVSALQAVRREVLGSGFDGVLLVPAFLEAGRLTAADIHWAHIGPDLVPVGETEFARDPAFGYTASNLRDFVAQKSGGAIERGDVCSVSIADIRLGGPSRVRDLLADVQDGTWVVVNATEYSDLETVACGVLLAERAGRSFLFRTGPSFVRALSGVTLRPPLRGAEIRPCAGREHGLIVVGSHVSQTSRQVAALRARGTTTDIELDVAAIISGPDDLVTATAQRVAGALGRSDVLLYTSRTLVRGSDGADSLAIARKVSAALSRTVREALAAKPAWVIAKGGITSHDVALEGLGIRRAEVAGQLFPGVISVFRPIDAAPEAIGVPYVVFAGNVGGDETLAQVVAILNGEQEDT